MLWDGAPIPGGIEPDGDPSEPGPPAADRQRLRERRARCMGATCHRPGYTEEPTAENCVFARGGICHCPCHKAKETTMYASTTLHQHEGDKVEVVVSDYSGSPDLIGAFIRVTVGINDATLHLLSTEEIINIGERIARAGRELSARQDEARLAPANGVASETVSQA